MTAKELIYHLNNADATPRKYSGRGMYGKYCVGCTVKDAAAAFLLGVEVGGVRLILSTWRVSVATPWDWVSSCTGPRWCGQRTR